MTTEKLLIISEGPPPLGSTTAEGGALRAWGLARALAAHGFKVTFAYRSTFEIADDALQVPLPENMDIKTWNGKTITKLLDSHKIILMRYAMGEAQEITARLKKHHILVSDSYIPISIEVAARNSDDKYENDNYLRLQESSAIASRRADYFLYASPAQKNYYVGYLAGINKLNPATYKELESRMFEVPYGIEPTDKKSELLKAQPQRPTLLWYGAFYSWFDMEGLIEALQRVKRNVPNFRLLIAGAKNPYNKDPGLLAHYEKTMQSLSPINDVIEHIDWHPYDKRFEVYAQASAIITWNHEGLENQFAWRTRLMDFVLADKPIITNGGDPLGENLIQRGIAFRATADNLDSVFEKALKYPPEKSKFDEAAKRYSWEHITESLADALKHPTNMVEVEMIHKDPFIILQIRRLKRVLLLPLIIIRSIKTYGLKETTNKIVKVMRLKMR